MKKSFKDIWNSLMWVSPLELALAELDDKQKIKHRLVTERLTKLSKLGKLHLLGELYNTRASKFLYKNRVVKLNLDEVRDLINIIEPLK